MTKRLHDCSNCDGKTRHETPKGAPLCAKCRKEARA